MAQDVAKTHRRKFSQFNSTVKIQYNARIAVIISFETNKILGNYKKIKTEAVLVLLGRKYNRNIR